MVNRFMTDGGNTPICFNFDFDFDFKLLLLCLKDDYFFSSSYSRDPSSAMWVIICMDDLHGWVVAGKRHARILAQLADGKRDSFFSFCLYRFDIKFIPSTSSALHFRLQLRFKPHCSLLLRGAVLSQRTGTL